MQITKLFKEFFASEKASGFILIGCTIISLLIANSTSGENYLQLWQTNLGNISVEHWINDALMAIFFLLVGLEIERELYIGELSDRKNAMLPVFAAIGGVFVPAMIHLFFNAGSNTQNGFGIPMATDIAFALGILSLAGKNIPTGLKIFLTALAIIDDLCAIIIIALFYTTEFSAINLFIALGTFGTLFSMGKYLKVYSLWIYLAGGVIMWYFMYKSGVHATISGVLLAFAIPFNKSDEDSPSYKLQHFLHKPVAFFIMPLFALCNTGIIIEPGFYNNLFSKNSLGVILGLVIGKPLGIFSFSWLSVKIKLGNLPENVGWKHLFGAGLLGGIGFTMSIFITLLAFPDAGIIVNSKIAILVASVVAGLGGLLFLKRLKAGNITGKTENPKDNK